MIVSIAVASALAMWSDALKVKTAIGTGRVDVQFVEGSLEVEESGESGKDWVASCLVGVNYIEDEDQGNPSSKDDLDLNITIVNGYPGYGCAATFRVRNTGTVPVVGPSYEPPETPEGIELLFRCPPSQLDPGDEARCGVTISILQTAGQGSRYEVQLHLRYVQWNEWSPSTPPTQLTSLVQFRETNTEFSCPAKLGDVLPIRNGYYIVNASVNPSGKRVVNPGAFFGVIWIMGEGVKDVSIIDTFDHHFDVGDGQDGKVRVYIYDMNAGCTIHVNRGLNYGIDNESNRVSISLSLDSPLRAHEAVLVYIKFKPSDWLDQHWNSNADMYFENTAEISTNVGSTRATAVVQMVVVRWRAPPLYR